jgi:hypothetical protein
MGFGPAHWQGKIPSGGKIHAAAKSSRIGSLQLAVRQVFFRKAIREVADCDDLLQDAVNSSNP